jgi:hypothetical protein
VLLLKDNSNYSRSRKIPQQLKEEEEEGRAGSMAPAEFDRIWFLRMRTLPQLSPAFSEDRCCHAKHSGGGGGENDCERLILPSSATSSYTAPPLSLRLLGLGKSSETSTTVNVVADKTAGGDKKTAVDVDKKTAVDVDVKSYGAESGAAASLTNSEATDPPLPTKKSRWRNKAGGMCILL